MNKICLCYKLLSAYCQTLSNDYQQDILYYTRIVTVHNAGKKMLKLLQKQLQIYEVIIVYTVKVVDLVTVHPPQKYLSNCTDALCRID